MMQELLSKEEYIVGRSCFQSTGAGNGSTKASSSGSQASSVPLKENTAHEYEFVRIVKQGFPSHYQLKVTVRNQTM